MGNFCCGEERTLAKGKPLVVIAGPPAAGKGTQCSKIKDEYGYVHISTGDILRENVKQGTELGKKAQEYMDKGALVPSDLIVDLVKERLSQQDVKAKGCLLDGFPRAPDQAQAMKTAGLDVQLFLLIKVPDDTLVGRGVGRRLGSKRGAACKGYTWSWWSSTAATATPVATFAALLVLLVLLVVASLS